MGTTLVVFIEKGAKVNQEYYGSHVLASLIPEIDNLADKDYVFMQDCSRSHAAKSMVEYLNSHVSEFIKLDSWPPNNLNLSPIDYDVWSRLESMVNAIKITDVVQLKQHIIDCWKEIPQEEINKAIDAF